MTLRAGGADRTLEPGAREGQDRSVKVARSASWGLTASTSGQVPF
jgi:hypothetical protein